MAWIADSDREKLRAELERELEGDVELAVTVAEDASSRQALEVLEELAELSPRFTLASSPAGAGDAAPRIELRGRARGRVGFLGLPMGYEFPALVEALLDVSRGRTSLGEDVRERLSRLERPRSLEVFTTPT